MRQLYSCEGLLNSTKKLFFVVIVLNYRKKIVNMLSILGFTWNKFRQNFSEEEIRQIKNGFLKVIKFFLCFDKNC